MDNLTHGLTGALMGQAGLKRKTGLGLAALIMGANLPDIDVVSLIWLDGKEALGFRRGITHGPIGVALLPLGLAALLIGFDRWQDSRGKRPANRARVSFKWLYLLGLSGAISHSLMDWLNVYGVRFLYPFSKDWFYGDTLFIIDVWLWAVLIAGVWLSARREQQDGEGCRTARIGMAVALGYIGFNGAITTFDYHAGGELREPYPVRFISSPMPLFSWQRERIAQNHAGRWISSEWDGVQVGYGYSHSTQRQCVLPDLSDARAANTRIDGFLTWSRAPFAERAQDGSVILRDARYYDPRARDRFSLALPAVTCRELPDE